MPPSPENFDPADVRSKVRTAILRILDERGPKKTARPSPIDKEVSETGWDQLMPVVREVAKKLANKDRIHVTQQGGGRPRGCNGSNPGRHNALV